MGAFVDVEVDGIDDKKDVYTVFGRYNDFRQFIRGSKNGVKAENIVKVAVAMIMHGD